MAAQRDAATFLATVVLAPAITAKVSGLLIQPLFFLGFNQQSYTNELWM